MAYVLVTRLICLMFLFILSLVHPSCQRIFDFYEYTVVKKSTSFI